MLAGICSGWRCSPDKVLIIVDGAEGIMASCTEANPDEIRGLMFRAAGALPEVMG